MGTPSASSCKHDLDAGEGLAPPLSDGEGLGVLGIASPYLAWAKFGSYPLHFPTEPGQYVWGLKRPQCPLETVFMDCATSPPVTAIKPLGGVLGELPALTPTGRQPSREQCAGRGSSPKEGVPLRMLTCKPHANRARQVRLRHGPWNTFLTFTFRRPRDPHEFHLVAGFAFVASETDAQIVT